MRRFKRPAPEPQEPLGEYTAGYYNTALTPQANNSFVIQHNMGIVPKVVIVKPNFEPTQGANTTLEMLCTFDTYGSQSEYCFVAGRYWYNNTITSSSPVSNTSSATSTSVTLVPIYSVARSPWNTSGTYTVRILG